MKELRRTQKIVLIGGLHSLIWKMEKVGLIFYRNKRKRRKNDVK